MPDDVVDRVTARLEPLADLPVTEHPAAFDVVHRLLQDALRQIDEV